MLKFYGIWDTSGSVLFERRKREKRICHLVDFATNNKLGIKESEKENKLLNHGRELEYFWNMRGKEIPVVVGALETVSRNMEKRLEELEIIRRIKTIQDTRNLRSARIQESRDLLSFKLQWKTNRKPWC